MNLKTPWLAATLLLCPLGAQDEPAKPSKDVEAVKAELQAEQENIVKEWRSSRAAAAKAAQEAKEAGKPIPAMSMRPDFGPIRTKAFAAAKKFTGDDAAEMLVMALQLGSSGDDYKEALDLLLADHLDGDAIGEVANIMPHLTRLISAEYSDAVVAKVMAHGKNAKLMAWALYGKHEATFKSQPATSEAFQNAKAVVAEAIAKAGDKGLKRTFDGLVAEQESFGIGMTAPDIAGIDLDGVEFKLSDYKGKVIFVDFWGDW